MSITPIIFVIGIWDNQWDHSHGCLLRKISTINYKLHMETKFHCLSCSLAPLVFFFCTVLTGLHWMLFWSSVSLVSNHKYPKYSKLTLYIVRCTAFSPLCRQYSHVYLVGSEHLLNLLFCWGLVACNVLTAVLTYTYSIVTDLSINIK